MKTKFPLLILLLAMLTLGVSCGDDEGDDGDPDELNNIDCSNFLNGQWGSYELLEEAINYYTAAATTYFSDPSSANCDAYEDALDDYIDVLGEIWSECYGGFGEDWEDIVEETDADC